MSSPNDYSERQPNRRAQVLLHPRLGDKSPQIIGTRSAPSSPRAPPATAGPQRTPLNVPNNPFSSGSFSSTSIRFHTSDQWKNSISASSTSSTRRDSPTTSPFLERADSVRGSMGPPPPKRTVRENTVPTIVVSQPSVSTQPQQSSLLSSISSSSSSGPTSKPTPTWHIVSVTLCQGRDIIPSGVNGNADPYVVLAVSSSDNILNYSSNHANPTLLGTEFQKRKSKVAPHGLRPVWNERFDFRYEEDLSQPTKNRPEALLLELYDRDYSSKDDFLGSAYLDLKKYWCSHDDELHPFEWIDVVAKGRVQGQVQVQIYCRSTDNAAVLDALEKSHFLKLRIFEARDLPPYFVDPYCEIQFSGSMYRTEHSKSNQPRWSHSTCYFWVRERIEKECKAIITVRDRQTQEGVQGAFTISSLLDRLSPDHDVNVVLEDSWIDLTTAKIETDEQPRDSSLGTNNLGNRTSRNSDPGVIQPRTARVRISVEISVRTSIEQRFFDDLISLLEDSVEDETEADDGTENTRRSGDSTRAFSSGNTSTATSTNTTLSLSGNSTSRGSSSAPRSNSTKGAKTRPKVSELSKAQVAWLFELVGSRMDDATFEAWFENMDQNKNGTIDRSEFDAFLRSARGHSSLDVPKLLLFISKGASPSDLMTVIEQTEQERILGRSQHIMVKDLESGVMVRENIPSYVSAALRAMTTTRVGRIKNTQSLFHALSVRQGKKYDDPASKEAILPFVRLHRINLDEVEKPLEEYPTFNSFFARKLKPNSRPIDRPTDASCAIVPADCRMVVFETVQQAAEVWIKGQGFTVSRLLGEEAGRIFGSKFSNASVAVARLAPQDYHRWHFPLPGVLGTLYLERGSLYPLSPLVVNQPLDVLTENKRAILPLYTTHFGLVLLVVIGALMVGSLEFDGGEGDKVNKGDIGGEFRFGGSTVVVMFENGRAAFERRLVSNSLGGVESLVRMGSFLAHAVNPPQQIQHR